MSQLQHKYTLELNNNLLQVRISENFKKHRYNWSTNRHCNAEYELHILLNGNIPVEIEGNNITLEAGEGILIPPGRYHAPLIPNGPIEHFAVSFFVSDSGFASELNERISDYNHFIISEDLAKTCREIYRECENIGLYRNEKIKALLTDIMISALRILDLNKEATTDFSAIEPERADIIDNFFSLYLECKQGAKQLAEQLHVSERQLNRIIRQLYKMTFQQKMTQTKMERAAWLLKTTAKKVGEIAQAVGYGSEPAFYQAFKKYFKVTPQEYRMLKNYIHK